MPWVEVVNEEDVDPLALDALSEQIQEIVAKALHAQKNKDAHLTKNDVETKFCQADRRSKCRQLNIIIHANDYPERRRNIKQRAQQIANKAGKLVNSISPSPIHGMVYIPTMGGFAEF